MIIAAILFALLSISSASNFAVFNDKAPNIKSLEVIPAGTVEECQNKAFADKKVTVAAFNGSCVPFALSGLNKLYLTANFKTNSILKDSEGWITFVPKGTKPFILWPLTEDSQGKNFGTGGKAFDLPIPKDRCEFVPEGPEPWTSGGKFCRLGCLSTDTAAMVPIVQNNHRLIDFSKEFTFELWIKSYPVVTNQPIITTAPKFSLRFMFWPSSNFDQLVLAFSEDARQFDFTTIDGTDKTAWRYLAVTYKPPNKVAFFKNAKEWPMCSQLLPKKPKTIPSTHLRMFFYYLPGPWNENTYATMAMVGIHKKALSQDELKKSMVGGSLN